MSILDLGPVIFGKIEDQITWFQQRCLLVLAPLCPVCTTPMQMQARSDVQDKYKYIQYEYAVHETQT